MNVIRSVKFAAALLPLFTLPTLAQAESADPKMDACIKAFVEGNVEKDRPVQVRKLFAFDNPVDPHATQQTIYISARLKDSGKRVAKGTCTVKGDVVVLTLEGKSAQTTKLAQAEGKPSTSLSAVAPIAYLIARCFRV